MPHNFRKFQYLLLAACLSADMASRAEAGSVSFSTYYPAPFGIYDRLRLPPRSALAEPCDAGTFYYETGVGLRFCDEATQTWGGLGGGVWTQSGNNIYPSDTATNPNLKVGIGMTAPEFKLTVDNDGGILAKGTFGSGATLATSGPGTRLIWYPRKVAFRAGVAQGTEWNDANIGDGSVAMGDGTKASGLDSTAMGRNTTASGISSTAMGSGTTASGGAGSTAMGGNTTASGFFSTAMGNVTTASELSSTAMGGNTTASGRYSTAMGLGTTSQAVSSTVLGQYNIISGDPITWISTDPLFVIGNGTDAVNRANAMTVLKSGNVGIGTLTPTALTHIIQTGVPIGLRVEKSGGADWAAYIKNTSIAGSSFGLGIFAGGDINDTPLSIYDRTGTTNFLHINGLGNVGIGTTAPQKLLHLSSSNDAIIRLQSTFSGARTYDISSAGGNPGSFFIYDVTSGASRVIIDPAGNVSIGTTAPGYKLDVAGQIRATGGTPIYQCPNGDPDYNRNQCVSQLSTNPSCLYADGGGEYTASCTLVGRLVAP